MIARCRNVLAAVALVVLSGCAGGDSSTVSTESPSSIVEALGLDETGSFHEVTAHHVQRHADDSLRLCMLSEGFPYLIEEATIDQFTSGGTEANLSVAEYARSHGFGVSEMLATFLLSTAEATAQLEAGIPVDPNADFYGELSSEGQLAYGEALESCNAAALDLTEDLYDSMAELNERFVEVHSSILADPRMIEADQRWTRCMAENGFNFAGHEQMLNGFFEEGMALVTPLLPAGGQISDDEVQLTQEAQDDLDDFRAREFEAAISNAACIDDYDSTFERVAVDLERAFVASNKALVDKTAKQLERSIG